MVPDEYEIYQDDHLVSYIMSNHWVVHVKLIKYHPSAVIQKIKFIKK